MANEKVFQSRIQLKHDTEENWLKATNFIPKEGEIVIYDVDENNPIARFKIGDGTTKVNQLSFVSHHKIISYLPQVLSEEEKAQARENISAISLEELADVAYINKEDNENIENPDVEMTNVVVDSALSETSINPVQNKVITQELSKVSSAIADKADKTGWTANKYLGTDASGNMVEKEAPQTDTGGITEETDPTVPSWAKQQQKPTYTASEVGALPDTTKIPEATSDLTNDSGFITKTVADLVNYYTKSQTYTQAEVNALVSEIPKFGISVVNALPTSGISKTTIYLVKSGSDVDLYTEYIFIVDDNAPNDGSGTYDESGGAWEILGSQKVDLTGYATEAWVNQKLGDYLTADTITAAMVTNALGYTPAKSTDVPVVDSTLTKSGQAADAAIVGQKLTEQSEAIADLDIPRITQEAGESESLVMSQKAVTDLVRDAVGSGGGTTEYETVDSVDDMTDTSKSYVLSSTGTIWAYGEFTEEKEAENKFVPSTASINTRHGTSSTSAANGYFVSDYIKVDKFTEVDPYIMRIFKSAGVGFDASLLAGNCRIHYFDANKTLLDNKYLFATAAATTMSSPHTDANGNIYFHIDEQLESNGGSTFVEITDFDHSKVAYVRVTLAMNQTSTAITENDIANVIITFDADAGITTESKWYDTELIPSAGGSDGNYVDLLVKVNQNKSDIVEVSNRVTALETGSETLTIPSFWQSAVDECIAKIKALQVGRNCITFPFFSDNHTRNGYAGILIAKIMQECHIPYCFYGGDSIDSGYIADEETMIAQDKAFDEAMSYIPNGRFCRAVGNHDGYWAVSADEKHYYTREQVYELFLREESVAQNKHFGDDGTYYYVDDIASKTRFIILNTNGGSVDSTQLVWMQNVALSFSESGWAVVFISHQPISNHYHALISNAAEVRAVVADYINGTDANKADVVGWFSGHIHRDRMYTGVATNTSDDTEGDAMGFTQVTITSDHTGIAYDDATKHTVANDDQSHAIDFVTVNKVTRTVNLTRLGIGDNRSYTY